jgi:hypothetical protein
MDCICAIRQAVHMSDFTQLAPMLGSKVTGSQNMRTASDIGVAGTWMGGEAL